MGVFLKFKNGDVWGPIAPDKPGKSWDDLKVYDKAGKFAAKENKLCGECVCLVIVKPL